MKRSLFLLLATIWISSANAQSSGPEVISSAGETFPGSTMQIDWTLGELAIITIQDVSHKLTQGFHQPTYILISVDELPGEIGKIKVFPNPTSDWLEMNLEFDQDRKIQIQLFDLSGKLIWSRENHGQQISETVNTAGLPGGNYLLNFLIDGNRYSHTVKIQKIN